LLLSAVRSRPVSLAGSGTFGVVRVISPAPSSGEPKTTCGHAGDPGRDHLIALDVVGAAV
jgi:hypothetical protein